METSNNKLVPFAIVFAGLLIAGAIYLGGGRNTDNLSLTGNGANTANTNAAVNNVVDIAKVTDKDHIVGPLSAGVVMVEYSDTECPFCKDFHNTMRKLMDNYKDGSVAWVYRHFPIASLHSKAPHEAEATECATLQGGNTGFWNYIDKIFETTSSNDSLDPGELPKIAGDIGLDVTAFNTCLSSGKYTKFITDSVAAAVKAGARGTPYTVITSNKLINSQTESAIAGISAAAGYNASTIMVSSDKYKVVLSGDLSYDAVKKVVDILKK